MDIKEIKKRIKSIQRNFNPEKATYKILEDILTNNYTPHEIVLYLNQIKGVEKYPDELKSDFLDIVDALEKLVVASSDDTIDSEEFSDKEDIKDEQELKNEDTTKELKAIIDALEDTEKAKKRVKQEVLKEEVKEESNDSLSLEEVIDNENLDDSTIASKIFKVILAIVILCFLVAVLLILFY